MEARPQSKRLDWNSYINWGDLQPFLSDLPPSEAGNMFHSYLEENVDVPGTEWEGRLFDGEEFVGRFDCYDELEGVVYEFKTKNGSGMKQAPFSEDISHVKRYLDGLDADVGFLVYVYRDSLEIEDYPVVR